MRVAFTPIGGGNWTGGYHYLKNLLTALAHSAAQTVTPVLFCGPEVSAEAADALGSIAGVEMHRVAPQRGRTRRARLARAILLGRDPLMRSLIAAHRIAVIFESAEYFGWRAGVPALAWIPDFQHRLLPHLFSPAAYWRRELGFRAQVWSGRTIMLSSEDSIAACQRFYGVPRDRLALARFAVLPRAAPDPHAARAIADGYGLPKNFIYLPNQFWRHKNHLLVIEALELLRQKGVAVVVVASGRTLDPRHPKHFPALVARISAMQVAERFRILGMIPHEHLIALMYASDAVLNPSLSEGWSTTVEEARSLGAPLILSDLAVHREQAGAAAAYFSRHDALSLAEALRQCRPHDPAERAVAARAARTVALQRVAQFAADFEAAVSTTMARRRHVMSNRP